MIKKTTEIDAILLNLNKAIDAHYQWLVSMFHSVGNDSNLLIVFYVQIMPDDFVMQLHRF
ncbi:hypothetical protein ECZU41_43330 [Escherichia coli]|nr:hypothetical protein ECZU26_41030 [Escherichia coli]GHM09665.1 hypothetical protein ECZU41_43330 [Escherichia coli]